VYSEEFEGSDCAVMDDWNELKTYGRADCRQSVALSPARRVALARRAVSSKCYSRHTKEQVV